MNKIFLMAKLNGKKQRRFTISIILSIIFCSLLFLTVVSVAISINTLYVNINENDPFNREIRMSNIFDQTKVNRLLLIPHVESYKIGYTAQSLSEEYVFDVTLNEKTFRQNSLIAADVSGTVFTQNEILRDNDGVYVEPIVAGRTMQKGDKKVVLINELFVYLLGYETPEEILGQNITISLDGNSVEDIEIIGVYYRSLNYCGANSGDLYKELENFWKDKEVREFYGAPYSAAEEAEILDYMLQNNISYKLVLSDDVLFDVVDGHKAEEEMHQIVYLYADFIYNVEAICEEISTVTNHYYSEMDFIETVKKTVEDIQIAGISVSSVMLLVTLVSLICFIIIRINEQEKLTQLMIKMGYNSKDISLIYIAETMRFVIKALLIAVLSATVLTLVLDIWLQPTYVQMGQLERFVFLVNPWVLLLYFVLVSLITLGLVFVTVKSQLKKNKIV